MMQLIKLEYKRNPIHSYIVSFVILSIVILGLSYFFALVSHIKPEEAKVNAAITTYAYVFNMINLISLVSFSVFSSVLFSKYIIEEYKGDSFFLLSLYPVSRKKVFFSKVILCVTLTLLFSITSQLFVYLFFMLTESIMPIMENDVFTWQLLISVLPNITLVALQAVLVGLIAMRIGFINRSLPTTIISSVIISIIFCNIVTIGNATILNFVTIIFYIIILFTIIKQSEQVDGMELKE
ncbi:hypothetical protein [Lysinibacillus sp. LZ02]|uniref:hypothetical protein n=1 Tax=Lysinibacillus sp. LZ02 TaxID=3420668 RepID=UPI003D36C913